MLTVWCCIIGWFMGTSKIFVLKYGWGVQVSKAGYLEVGVQPYGGGLWHTWFDRDLTIAGRVIIRGEKDGSASYLHRLVRIEEPIMRIPTLAIHLERFSFLWHDFLGVWLLCGHNCDWNICWLSWGYLVLCDCVLSLCCVLLTGVSMMDLRWIRRLIFFPSWQHLLR